MGICEICEKWECEAHVAIVEELIREISVYQRVVVMGKRGMQFVSALFIYK